MNANATTRWSELSAEQIARLSAQQVMAAPAGELAVCEAQWLLQLKSAAAERLAAAKAVVEHIDRALEMRYATRARELRLNAGKDSGIVHFDDGEVRITADLPKKVAWDQSKLAQISQRIAASGEDPTQYVDISYRVCETKFNAWPQTLKSAFEPARTLSVGKPSFRLAPIKPSAEVVHLSQQGATQ